MIDWKRTLGVTRAALERVLREGDARSGTTVVRAATDLIEDGVTANVIPAELEDDLWKTIEPATRCPSEPEGPYQFSGMGVFGGLLTAALNYSFPRTIRAVIQTGLWTYRIHRANPHDSAAASLSEARLSPMLDCIWKRTGRDRVTGEIMIGEFLPQLQLVAPFWLDEHLIELLDQGAINPLEHPTWGGYITTARLYDSTFAMLRPWYVSAATAAGTPEGQVTASDDTWSLTQKLAEHVFFAVLRGLAAVGDDDRLVERTFANVSGNEIGRAYWNVFRGWSDAEGPPPPEFVSRLVGFWEWRLTELEKGIPGSDEAKGLGWFLRTPYLPDQDVLRLGARTAKAAEGDLELHTDWDRMVALVPVDPDAAFTIGELVLNAQLASQYPYVDVANVEQFLRAVLANASSDTRSQAVRLIHRLGVAGYDSFRSLVELSPPKEATP